MSLLTPALPAAQAPSGDWAQWRGPGRDGVIPTFTAPAKWPEQLTLKWKAEVIVTAFESGITAIRINKRDGKWGTDNAWKNDDQYCRFTNGVIVGDAYFSLSGKSGGMFMFLDARTGELLWKGEPRTAENAAIARAGNLLFALKDDGELIVVDGTTPTEFVRLARYQLSDSATWAQPSISGNRVFVKGVSTLAIWTID